MTEHKLGLQSQNGRHISLGRHRAPQEPQLFDPTHILGEEEAVDFDFLFRDDSGVGGDHRVKAAGKRKNRFTSGSLALLPTSPLASGPHLQLLSLSPPLHRPHALRNCDLPQGLLKHSFEQGHVCQVLVLGHLPGWHHGHHFLMQGSLDLWFF